MITITVINLIIVTAMTIEVSSNVVQKHTCDGFSYAFNETVHKQLRCRLELALFCGHNDAPSMETVDGHFGADCVEIITAFSTVVNPRGPLSSTPSACVRPPLSARRPGEKLQSVLTMAIEIQFLWKLSTAGMDVEVAHIAAVSESLDGIAADIALRLGESYSGVDVEDERVPVVVWMGDGRRSLCTEFMDADIALIASISSPGSLFLASMAGE